MEFSFVENISKLMEFLEEFSTCQRISIVVMFYVAGYVVFHFIKHRNSGNF